ncbi:MAG TPA: 4-hydroxythreonine-4-phosphate dehydrogenase PdxA, partial [Terriglobales bacterium]|nr:4-hydroxythreonine-4-phosphate dehydrogenase PdxA [Terriglobales bacterium]
MIGISLGDVTGIGPEVALKALALELPADDERYVLFGDFQRMAGLNEKLRLGLEFSPGGNKIPGRLQVRDTAGEPLPEGMPPGNPAAARAAVRWVEQGARACLSGEITALVTAPVNKEAILRAGISFVGQTELLSQLAGTERTAMMLLGQDERGKWLRVVLASTHVPLAKVASRLTGEKVMLAIELAAKACRDLGLAQSRIGVCGLNPHAGEGGKMGIEEQAFIGPAVAAAREKDLEVTGPFSADTLFHYAYRGDFEVVVAMYHDQGLAPLKMVCFDQGVNWTLGLPFVRTS